MLRKLTPSQRRESRAAIKRKAKARRDSGSVFIYRKEYRTKYGLGPRAFFALLDAQGYRCAICRQHSMKTLHVDHDHSNGRVRGLLCGGCNSLLGFAKDSPRILAMAIVYLEDHGISFLPDS